MATHPYTLLDVFADRPLAGNGLAVVHDAAAVAIERGEDEDAATGSAAGPLLAYLHERTGLERLEVAQGVAMGRPSRLLAEVEDGRVRVAGDVVVLVTGTLRLP